jgi:hypothetical protein
LTISSAKKLKILFKFKPRLRISGGAKVSWDLLIFLAKANACRRFPLFGNFGQWIYFAAAFMGAISPPDGFLRHGIFDRTYRRRLGSGLRCL